MTPKERAQKSANAMWSDDRASGWFGMELLDIDEGSAVLALTVQSHHVNGHNIAMAASRLALLTARLPSRVTVATKHRSPSTIPSVT